MAILLFWSEFDHAKKERGRQNRRPLSCGASDEARTRYLHLGKVALYQMSYTRSNKRNYSRNIPFVKGKRKKSLPYRNWNNCPNWT